jgi:hypothetical protein
MKEKFKGRDICFGHLCTYVSSLLVVLARDFLGRFFFIILIWEEVNG